MSNISQSLQAYSAQRLESLRNYRLPWWSHWAALADLFLPRRYRYFITPNNYNRGSQINQSIVDETGVLAARTLATGLLANLTSPTKQWFRLGIAGFDHKSEGPVQQWLAECTSRMLTVYGQSNFYTALGTAYHDNAVFGSSALIQYEDDQNVIHFFSPCLGEFFFGLNAKLAVDSLYREYTYTVRDTVKEFGVENVSPSTLAMYKSGGSSLDTEIVVCHGIEPNDVVYQSGESKGLACPSMFTYRECYWEQASPTNAGQCLRIKGYREKPFVGLRWDVTSNDAYGRSPGMDALSAVRQLQIEQRRKAEAIDKMVRPPMVASVSMRNEPASILPGSVTYTADPAASGFKPAFTVEPRIGELMEDLKEVQQRVRDIFFNNLFTGISDLETVRTATEIDARVQEKLVLLGPVVERTENEGLDDIISRTFAIMSRRGLFPPPPQEIAGAPIEIQYISILAEAQRAAATSAIERVFGFAGSLAGAIPQILDTLDADEAVEIYADLLNVPPEIIRATDAVAQIRAQRDAQLRQQQALQTGAAMAQGAKTLSDADVGGGQNALQAMVGGSA